MTALGCLSTPPRPVDHEATDAGIDASADAPTKLPTLVDRTSGLTMSSAGMLFITPPPMAAQGDLVVLYLDRFWSITRVPSTSNWTSVAHVAFDMDSHEILYRTAVANESTQGAVYAFPAGTLGTPPDAVWVIDVWRGARTASMVQAMSSPTPTGMPPFQAVDTPGHMIVDASVSDYNSQCTLPAGIEDFNLWSLYTVAERADALTFTCTPDNVFGEFQITIDP